MQNGGNTMKGTRVSRYVGLYNGEFRKITRVSFPPVVTRLVDLPVLYLLCKYKGRDIHVGYDDKNLYFEVAMSDAMYERFVNEMKNKDVKTIRSEIEYNERFIRLMYDVLRIIENARSINFLGLKDSAILGAFDVLEQDIKV